MLHFFYDSLDTLKKVKKPTWKEVRIFTIQVFVAVIVGAAIFFILDTLRGNLYQQIFQTFWTPQSVTTSVPTEQNLPVVPDVPDTTLPAQEPAVDVGAPVEKQELAPPQQETPPTPLPATQ